MNAGNPDPTVSLKHTHLWWSFWKDFVRNKKSDKKPIVGELNVKIFKVSDVNLNSMTFNAKVLVTVWVKNSQFEDHLAYRIKGYEYHGLILDNNGNVIPKNDREDKVVFDKDEESYMPQFNPKVIITNMIKETSNTSWARTKRNNEYTMYNQMIEGVFTTSMNSSWFPLDDHGLTVRVSTDWSTDFFVLNQIPDNDQTPDDRIKRNVLEIEYNQALTRLFYVDRVVLIKKNENSKGSPKNDEPTKSYEYSDLSAIIHIKRKAGLAVFFTFFRPIVLVLLVLASFAFPATDRENLAARLNLIIGLLLSISLSILYKKEDFFAFQDYVVSASYIVIGAVTIETALLFFFIASEEDPSKIQDIGDRNSEIDFAFFVTCSILVVIFLSLVALSIFYKSVLVYTPSANNTIYIVKNYSNKILAQCCMPFIRKTPRNRKGVAPNKPDELIMNVEA